MTIELRTMTEREARVITERIRISAHNYTEARTKLMQHVQEAKDGNAHDVLGYASWTAYLAEVLGEEPMRLARDERQDMVRMLANEGMSTRAIAPIVGKTHTQVRRDLQVEHYVPPAPESEPAPLTDAPGQVIKLTGSNSAASPGEELPKPEKIIGMDGKQYKRPEPKPDNKPRPESITSQFTGAITELNKILDKFYRISENKNFDRNKEQVATLHGSDLNRAISELQNLADALN